jgi:hypothetical protein
MSFIILIVTKKYSQRHFITQLSIYNFQFSLNFQCSIFKQMQYIPFDNCNIGHLLKIRN